MLGDEQLLPAAGLHVQVAVVDEQQLQKGMEVVSYQKQSTK